MMAVITKTNFSSNGQMRTECLLIFNPFKVSNRSKQNHDDKAHTLARLANTTGYKCYATRHSVNLD
jgi:hypothetical protein